MNTEQKAREWLASGTFDANDLQEAEEIITALLAEREAFESRIAQLEKPYVGMTDIELYRIKDSFEYTIAENLGRILKIESHVIARYNEQRSVK